ncbi:hypothetical protein SDC9_119692 [bioreactor metagenome]|uniref:Uncharacterized protein n=1 Tax=bioreactor metagenome TaxID=1076179 RepID=A0A645C4K5_9ZZZZ
MSQGQGFTVTPGAIVSISLRYKDKLSMSVNGNKIAPDITSYVAPVALGALAYVGNMGATAQANTLYYDACFSNIYRSDSEDSTRAAYAQANRRFPDDQYVTYHANFDRPDAQRALRSIVL